eukprot:m51a1_g50 hypothetical protein (384) ;mRNA; r:169353-170746
MATLWRPLAALVCALAALTAGRYTAWDQIAGQGYPVELHTTTTRDGYHISSYRIPRAGATAVLFVHGLLSSALGWVANAPRSSLPFLFHDAGYDVWIANMRGTSNATGHERLRPDSREYWDWSFAERGLYDMPALVELATRVSGSPSVVVVGHSEGTTEPFVFLSMEREQSAKVSLFMALSPVVHVKDTQSWPFVVAKTVDLYRLTRAFGVAKVCANDRLVDVVGEAACRLLPGVCDLAFSAIAGWDLGNADRTREDVYVASGDCTSAMDFGHGFQLANTNELRLFDYGRWQNRRRYGQDRPPLVPVGNITTPIALFYGGRDAIVVPEDVEKYTIPGLNPQALERTPPRRIDSWNHLDFMWSADPTEYRGMVATCRRIVSPSQ